MESIFTVDTIRPMLEQFPHIPVLAGRINTVSLLFHTNIKYAIFGHGRKAISDFIDQYFGVGDFSAVPNLFLKDGERIFYSGRTEHWDLEGELFSNRPSLAWQYLGPQRNPTASFNDIGIIAGMNCLYSSSTASSHSFNIRDTVRGLGYNISVEALKRLEEIYNRKNHGVLPASSSIKSTPASRLRDG